MSSVESFTKEQFETEVMTEAGLVTQVDWSGFWLVPALGSIVGLVIFIAFFRHRIGRPGQNAGAAAEPSGE